MSELAQPPATGAQTGPGAPTHSELLLRLLFQAVRVNDAALNRAAAELLVQFGTKPVPRLIRVAVDRKNSRPHRLRALTLIGRIGKLSSPDDYQDLHLLLWEKDPILRELMLKVLPPLGIPVGPSTPTAPARIADNCRTKAAR